MDRRRVDLLEALERLAVLRRVVEQSLEGLDVVDRLQAVDERPGARAQPLIGGRHRGEHGCRRRFPAPSWRKARSPSAGRRGRSRRNARHRCRKAGSRRRSRTGSAPGCPRHAARRGGRESSPKRTPNSIRSSEVMTWSRKISSWCRASPSWIASRTASSSGAERSTPVTSAARLAPTGRKERLIAASSNRRAQLIGDRVSRPAKRALSGSPSGTG